MQYVAFDDVDELKSQIKKRKELEKELKELKRLIPATPNKSSSLNDTKLKSDEEHTIVINKMYGLSKADAPLHITGTRECDFTR